MRHILGLLICYVLNLCGAENFRFPEGFKFGAASAAYQVEGAWNVSDKSESIWDRFVHSNSHATADGSTGDETCRSYYMWEQDVQIASDLGLNFYRFSISWSRILPQGFSHYVSEDGKNYYNNLIDGLIQKGIEPMVTLYHFDLPQKLQDLGGWTNPLITTWFAEYAKTVFTLFGDKVKLWATINEPVGVCAVTYNEGLLAPGIVETQQAEYICNKNVLIAHAKAWRIYDKEFKPKYHGKVSLINHLIWYEAATQDDVELAELANQYCTGRYSHAIYSETGGWPPAIEKIVAENSKKQGYSNSRLPALTPLEIDLIKGTYDFFGFNYYSGRVIRKAKPGEKLKQFVTGDIPELGIKVESRSEWSSGSAGFYTIYPAGIRYLMNWIKNHYGNLEMFIAENGYCDSTPQLDDDTRILFMDNHLRQILLAIWEDGLNITGYTYWSLMDNFEWMEGYGIKFGLYEIDFSNPERPRTPRKSAKYYASVIKNHSVIVPLEPAGWINGRSPPNHTNGQNINISSLLLFLLLLFSIDS